MIIKRIFLTLILIGMATALILSAYPTANAAQPNLVGTWHIKVPGENPGEVAFEALQTYHADGTLTETSSLLGLLDEGPAHGVWSSEGDDYAVTFYLFTFDEESREHTGMVRVRLKLHLDGPDHLIADPASVADFIDPNGVVTLLGSGGWEGARVKVEPILDPITVVKSYYDAFNAKDIDKAMTFVTDDVVATNPFETYSGKEALKKADEDAVKAGLTFELSDLKETEGRVTSCYKVYEKETLIDQACDGVTIVRGEKIIFDGLEPAEALFVVQRYIEAHNAKDLDMSMSFLADDALLTYPGGKFEGKEAIRQAEEGFLDDDCRTEASNYREEKGEVRYDYKVYCGDEMVDQNTDGLTIVKDGLIVFDGLEKDKPQ